jgi:hypothetical protein
MNEDACQIYRGNAAEKLACCRHISLNMLITPLIPNTYHAILQSFVIDSIGALNWTSYYPDLCLWH